MLFPLASHPLADFHNQEIEESFSLDCLASEEATHWLSQYVAFDLNGGASLSQAVYRMLLIAASLDSSGAFFQESNLSQYLTVSENCGASCHQSEEASCSIACNMSSEASFSPSLSQQWAIAGDMEASGSLSSSLASQGSISLEMPSNALLEQSMASQGEISISLDSSGGVSLQASQTISLSFDLESLAAFIIDIFSPERLEGELAYDVFLIVPNGSFTLYVPEIDNQLRLPSLSLEILIPEVIHNVSIPSLSPRIRIESQRLHCLPSSQSIVIGGSPSA